MFPSANTSAICAAAKWSFELSINIELKLYREEEKKLQPEEETACRDIVNKLYLQMETTFADYKIPPPFFGPL